MSIFDSVLKESESLFKNELALSYEFIPKMIPFRESQQRIIASCIAPLFQNRNGRNLIIYGPPGVGKTVATRHVLMELEEKTDEIFPIYINCWQRNTSFKIMLDICQQIGYSFTHNKKTDELFSIIRTKLNKMSTVFVFDEIDKAEDKDFLYWILSDILQKSVILLTNYKSVITDMDMRIKSRLTPETVEFLPYNKEETVGILDKRRELAFHDGVWKKNAFQKVADKTNEIRDIRSGLYLLKESGLAGEERASKLIEGKDVNSAIRKLEEFKIKNSNELEDDIKSILALIKSKASGKIGDLYKEYQKQGGTASYKTFQRKINKLTEGKFITAKRITGGAEGNTTMISYNTATKTLDEF
jgi:archaeal cell division control protein 6